MTLREEASAILGIRIEPDGWEKEIERLDVSGGFTRRKEMELVMMLCKRIEKLEDHVYSHKAGHNTDSTV